MKSFPSKIDKIFFDLRSNRSHQEYERRFAPVFGDHLVWCGVARAGYSWSPTDQLTWPRMRSRTGASARPPEQSSFTPELHQSRWEQNIVFCIKYWQSGLQAHISAEFCTFFLTQDPEVLYPYEKLHFLLLKTAIFSFLLFLLFPVFWTTLFLERFDSEWNHSWCKKGLLFEKKSVVCTV
jgi:hypothetical protein